MAEQALFQQGATSQVSAASGQWQVSTAGGIGLRWRADGKELYYIAPDAKLMAAPDCRQRYSV